MLFCCQHDYSEDELGCQEHLNEESLSEARPSIQARGHSERTREENGDNACRCHSTEHLCNEDETTPGERYGANET